jgi:YVTN family beta-propeller protein
VLPDEERTRRFRARRPALLAAAALLAACAIGLAVLLISGGDTPEPAAGAASQPAGTVDARIRVGDSPAGVALEGKFAWVANEGDGTVTRIDRGNKQVRSAPIPVGKNPRAVAAAGGNVWVANFGGGSVTRIDARTGRVLKTIPVGLGPIDIAVGEKSVWVSTQDARIVKIDAHTGQIVDPDIGIRAQGALDLGRGRLWIADPLEGTLRVYFVGSGEFSDPLLLGDTPADIRIGRQYAWAALAGEGAIRRIQLATGRSEQVETGGRPEALAMSKTGVWVADGERDTLYRIDRATGRPAGGPIKVGEDPAGVAVSKRLVWVTSAATDRVLVVVPQ